LSFLLNGEKMRQRLAQILEQTEESQMSGEDKNENRNKSNISRTSAFE